MSNYRTNANDASLQDQFDELKKKVTKTMPPNKLSDEQYFTIKMTRTIVSGIVALILSIGICGYGCNRDDNITKLTVANKMCPCAAQK